jgi:hypothetical protein
MLFRPQLNANRILQNSKIISSKFVKNKQKYNEFISKRSIFNNLTKRNIHSYASGEQLIDVFGGGGPNGPNILWLIIVATITYISTKKYIIYNNYNKDNNKNDDDDKKDT